MKQSWVRRTDRYIDLLRGPWSFFSKLQAGWPNLTPRLLWQDKENSPTYRGIVYSGFVATILVQAVVTSVFPPLSPQQLAFSFIAQRIQHSQVSYDLLATLHYNVVSVSGGFVATALLLL